MPVLHLSDNHYLYPISNVTYHLRNTYYVLGMAQSTSNPQSHFSFIMTL